MLSSAGKAMLEINSIRHHFGSDPSRFEGPTLLEQGLVVIQASRAEENFEVDDGAGSDEAFFQQRSESSRDRWQRDASQSALVGQMRGA
ncbi:MAG TPA: hypothetical protein VFZ97_14470 [Acidimicrobiales bacterium]